MPVAHLIRQVGISDQGGAEREVRDDIVNHYDENSPSAGAFPFECRLVVKVAITGPTDRTKSLMTRQPI